MKIEYPSRVKKSTLSRGSVLFLSSGLRPPLTGIRISCSTGATELAAGEFGKPTRPMMEGHTMRYMELKNWENKLTPEEKEALTDYNISPNDTVSEDNILSTIIRWKGGCADWYEIKDMIRRIYGICL